MCVHHVCVRCLWMSVENIGYLQIVTCHACAENPTWVPCKSSLTLTISPVPCSSFGCITRTRATESSRTSLLYILGSQQLHSAVAEPVYRPTRDVRVPVFHQHVALFFVCLFSVFLFHSKHWWWLLWIWLRILWAVITLTCFSPLVSLELGFMVAKMLQALVIFSQCWGK